MRTAEFHYELPPGLIAQYPVVERDHSRLMVLHRRERSIEHKSFFEITNYLEKGDVLVLNDTKVIPARLSGKKQSGGKVEVLLVKHLGNGSPHESIWQCLVKCSKKAKVGSKILFDQSLSAEVVDAEGEVSTLRFICEGNFEQMLDYVGGAPLPPYIKRSAGSSNDRGDRERYQTVFARSEGAVAAPTAGLHFTKQLLNCIAEKGVQIVYLTLHVGWGTFKPVRVKTVEKHRMDREEYDINTAAAHTINEARKQGTRIISVGTTTTRLLESVTNGNGTIQPGRGYTSLFIHPGYTFKAIDCLITNFHLPCSTLIMLVAAFAGKEFILEAYQEAIKRGYRFYSYGDAMLII